jgi:SSS family solute:Na+ symporter
MAGLAMIGSKSILDVWWELSGIFAGGMLGLFLLGLISRQTKNSEAITAGLIGIAVILWMTFSNRIGVEYGWLKSTFDNNMIVVIGTLTIFLTGVLLTKLKRLLEKTKPL